MLEKASPWRFDMLKNLVNLCLIKSIHTYYSILHLQDILWNTRADSRFTTNQWETSLIGWPGHQPRIHYDDVIMSVTASQITSLTIVYSTVYPGADQSKHQSSASLAFVWGIHRGPVNSPHKWPVTRKMFPFDDVIMSALNMLSVMCFLSLGYMMSY